MQSLAPTSTLPPLGRLSSTPSLAVQQALHTLRSVYFPHQSPILLPKAKLKPLRAFKAAAVRGDETPFIDSGYASAEEEGDSDEGDSVVSATIGHTDAGGSLIEQFAAANLDGGDNESDDDKEAKDVLRSDTFERAFAIKWLTGFISRAEAWIEAASSSSTSSASATSSEADADDDAILRAELLEECTNLLSSFIDGEDEGPASKNDEDLNLTRSFVFPTKSKDAPIHVTLNDAPVSSEDHTSVGLQSWGSCILFAEKLCAEPQVYLADPRPVEGRGREKPLRVLELGAGTGMLSIVAGKLMEGGEVAPVIVATDYHPDVLANLARNIETNFGGGERRAKVPVEVEVLDWEAPTDDAPFDEPFDIILAADVVYHPMHAEWIEACVSKLLRKPARGAGGVEDEGGVFWMFMAIRGTGRHEGLDASVDAMFGGREQGEGLRLGILEREDVRRRGGVGRADEDCYKLSKIGWV
ncbi:putative methyltransferase-domain-containing protein [Ephemerocybe angulata]|uniref:Putative methyltransferase-domain-containing protein n=1 Tax=Ephemerocybe angulata TaxID=980116 RepID=A0A8H6I9G0_9AGAR|nr:putative methyltransferase-domain-containing protein [Tulosesus angulatus]